MPRPSSRGKAPAALKVLPARAIPVVPEDRVVPAEGRAEPVVPEDQAVRVDPVVQAVREALEDQAARADPGAEVTQEVPGAPEVDRVDPAVVQAARVVPVAEVTQEGPAVPEVDRVDPAGTNDPAASDEAFHSALFKIEKIP